MAHILLIRPPSVFSASTYSAPVTMPLANAYLSANLLKHGHRVTNIDALGEDIDHIDVSYHPRVRYRGLSTENILARITERPDGIGVSVMFSQDWPHIEDMINAIYCLHVEDRRNVVSLDNVLLQLDAFHHRQDTRQETPNSMPTGQFRH